MTDTTKTTSTATTGAATLVGALQQLGVELAFGLPGVHNLSIWEELSGSSIRLVGVRHEQAAVYAADGYARATGSLGVALVTTGPGAANTLGATGEAMASASPVLVIATEIPSALHRPGVYRGVLHETRDQTAMFAPVTKVARVVGEAELIAGAVLDAGADALAAPSGPAYLGIPTDLLSAEIAAAALPEPPPRPAPVPPEAELEKACALLADASRPLIWAGGGALRSGAGEQVSELARKLSAPALTTYGARGLLAPEHPCFVAGPVHVPAVGALWDEADLVLALGTDFDGMMTQNWLMPRPPALIAVNVDAADANKNYSSDVTLAGDVAAVLTRLLPLVPDRGRLDATAARLRSIGREVAAGVQTDDEQAARFLEITERVLPADAVVLADMCIPGYWLAGFRRVPAPRRLAYPVGWGTLGFAFPAALGAGLAGVGPAVCFCGDGGFLFACGELATVVESRVPLTIVVVNDGGYGMLRFDQVHAGREPFGVDLTQPDFVAMAGSFGVAAEEVEGFGDSFEAALARAVASDRPEMIVVHAALKPPPTTSPRWYRRVQSK